MNNYQVKFLESKFYNSTERLFHKIHKYYPDELYIMLRYMGFSNDSVFPPIQREMDRLFSLQKEENNFAPINYNPF